MRLPESLSYGTESSRVGKQIDQAIGGRNFIRKASEEKERLDGLLTIITERRRKLVDRVLVQYERQIDSQHVSKKYRIGYFAEC